MSQESYRSIANFFFFAFLDEALALESATRISAQFKTRMQNQSTNTQTQNDALIVYLTNQAFQSHRKHLYKGHSLISQEGGWLLPEGLDLSAWKQFHKEVPDQEMLAVLWSQILGLSDAAISEGLGVTAGTVRYRVGHGLRKLGAIHRFKVQTV